jgi:hypothetical protein
MKSDAKKNKVYQTYGIKDLLSYEIAAFDRISVDELIERIIEKKCHAVIRQR